MPDGPVQLILNTRDFVDARPPMLGGGSGKDFYAGADALFAGHRDDLARSLDALATGDDDDRVNVLVTMRPDALAKSHRPFGKLFAPARASHVGTAGYGELIFACTVRRLRDIADLIRSAETTVVEEPNSLGEMRSAPTKQRTESGAIDSIGRWSPSRNRGYSLDEADAWLASDGSGAGFNVELLDIPPRGRLRFEAEREVERLGRLPEVLERRVKLSLPDGIDPAQQEIVSNAPVPTERAGADARAMLPRFESSTAVKRVRLEDRLGAIDPIESRPPELPATIGLETQQGRRAPVVGVIDGGVGGSLKDAVVGRSAVIADVHLSLDQLSHGTSIASVLRLGSALNPGVLDSSEDCDVYDIRIYPDAAYTSDYFGSMDEFFDQLRSDVERARDEHGVRVFNLSLNLRSAPGSGAYSLAARRLDEIGLDLDVVFVVSAGNLPPADQRPEWPPSDRDAVSMLAQVGAPDGIGAPAESLANLAVGAVSPPDLSPAIEGAPTRYSRRGGRVPSAIKPDLAAVSGASPDSARGATGFQGFNAFGNVVELRGTSFSAPVVARYLATLEASILGHVSRETLIALAIHHARIPALLRRKELADLASSFVGHGLPPSVEETLEGDPHRMTIVLADVIEPGKRIELPFSWPPSLTRGAGSCRGRVRLTLITRPALRYNHGNEFVRINLEAALQQATAEGRFEGRVTSTHQFFSGFRYANERTLAGELGKWSPIRTYAREIPRGVGASPDWRLELNYLTRAAESLPEQGTPFAVVLTIEDPRHEAPVFDEMRLSLSRTNVHLNDLRTALTVSAST